MDVFELPAVEDLLRVALGEDLGAGDLTTRLTVSPTSTARAQIRAKQAVVIAGLPLVRKICAVVGSRIEVTEHHTDGQHINSGDVLADLCGPASDLLGIERITLNFLQHLSGIATLTARFVHAVQGTHCRIADTRKTTPGLRVLEKYAVRVGGGVNHRFGLGDGILIKNNHITAAGGVAAAVIAARTGAPHGFKVEVECRTIAEVDEALSAGAEAILLDNMAVEQLHQAVQHIGGRAVTEASGGISLDNVHAVAQSGVDIISVGALTHSAAAVDLHMLLLLT